MSNRLIEKIREETSIREKEKISELIDSCRQTDKVEESIKEKKAYEN
jgi:hypothetical protein